MCVVNYFRNYKLYKWWFEHVILPSRKLINSVVNVNQEFIRCWNRSPTTHFIFASKDSQVSLLSMNWITEGKSVGWRQVWWFREIYIKNVSQVDKVFMLAVSCRSFTIINESLDSLEFSWTVVDKDKWQNRIDSINGKRIKFLKIYSRLRYNFVIYTKNLS